MGLEQRDYKPQLDHLAHMSADTIPHGTHIPIRLFKQFILDRGKVPNAFELGGGTGDKAELLHNELGFLVLLNDLNVDAIHEAEKKPVTAIVGDARRIDFQGNISAILWVESFPCVYSEGLLCNQEGDDLRRVLTTMSIALRPGGICLISDVARCDRYNHELARYFQDPLAYQRYQEKWRRRYRENAKAYGKMGKPLDYGSFMVAKPGPQKRREWGDSRELLSLLHSDDYEREARHVDIEEVNAYFQLLGIHPIHYEEAVWKSRTGEPLAGFVGVWQKDWTFLYHPIYKGMTHRERAAANDQRMDETREPGYVHRWIEQLKENLPEPEFYFRSLFDMK